MEKLIIKDRVFNSRFFLGTGKFASHTTMKDTIIASKCEIVTVALRRVDLTAPKEDYILGYIPEGITLMPNTSGARDAKEAIRLARLARAMCKTDFIKIEVINDTKYLLPDNLETIRVTEVLAKEGFIVMPYMNPDLNDARRLRDAGAASVMPLGAPIGTNKGVTTAEMIKILVSEMDIPVVVDAGIGSPSQAAYAMELGADAVLVNTAVAVSGNPVEMGRAFGLAVEAGRAAYKAELAEVTEMASASSPLTGFLHNS